MERINTELSVVYTPEPEHPRSISTRVENIDGKVRLGLYFSSIIEVPPNVIYYTPDEARFVADLLNESAETVDANG